MPFDYIPSPGGIGMSPNPLGGKPGPPQPQNPMGGKRNSDPMGGKPGTIKLDWPQRYRGGDAGSKTGLYR